METSQIINEFRNGNSEHRMQLYMAYREFRPIFEQIETEEDQAIDKQRQGASELNTEFRKPVRICLHFGLCKLLPGLSGRR